MIIEIPYNERVSLGYEHIPVYASANAITGTRYQTKVYLVNGPGKYYPLGQIDGRLDEEQIKAEFGEAISSNMERQYGTQRTLLRRDLRPTRERGPAHINPRLPSHYGEAGSNMGSKL